MLSSFRASHRYRETELKFEAGEPGGFKIHKAFVHHLESYTVLITDSEKNGQRRMTTYVFDASNGAHANVQTLPRGMLDERLVATNVFRYFLINRTPKVPFFDIRYQKNTANRFRTGVTSKFIELPKIIVPSESGDGNGFIYNVFLSV